MKAASAPELPLERGWAAEFKWDGMRISAATNGTDTELRSARGGVVTSRFPELEPLGRALGASALLDGEIVSFDGGRPSFRQLQHRIHNEDPSELLLRTIPVTYLIFDLLEVDDQPTIALPYEARRKLLSELVPPGPHWHVPAYTLDGGADLLAAAVDNEIEGVVLKRVDGPYRPGARSRDWLKFKIRHQQEFVVGGWLAGQGDLTDQMGSLIVGTWVDGELVQAGRVGSGLNDAERQRLAARFISRSHSPFVDQAPLDRKPTWVEPELVVQVGFSEWPADGSIRHPTYLGLRTDVDPRAVRRESPPPGGAGPLSESGVADLE